MSFHEEFQNPGPQYRGKPFWAWNGKLNPEELRRQVRIFKQMGMGGAFLHSRIGLATEYLGPEWFDAIRAAVEECRLEGLEAWLYDEDRWPSGCAGGRVTENPEHRMRFLVMEILPAKRLSYREEGDYPVWEANVEGDKAMDLRWLHPGERPSASHVLTFHEELQPCSDYYNGFTYLDVLSETAVRAFIEETHERYRQEMGDDFGSVIPGIFTDEPNFCAFYGDKVPQGRKGIPYSFVPWTPKLLETFEEMFNYSIRGHLPELMLEVDGEPLSKARLDFRNCLTHLFVHNFFKQIYEWCEAHKMKLTGHLLLEDRLHLQTLVVGAAMRAYEYMQTPGIDLLTQRAYDYDTPKQCHSVANQMERPWMLSELYGCTGWDFSFEGHKAVGDWQTALGVNLRCHHLSWYTMKGEAKRDYPASIFFQSPWWEHYRHVEDYYARLHVALTRGRCEQPLLVIHPIESMFARYRPRLLDHDDPAKFMLAEVAEEVRACDETLISVRNLLLENHLDFAYGDEEMLGQLGSVKSGKPGPRLALGACNYEAVIVPPMETMRWSTLDLLAAFRRKGGTVLFLGAPPALVDGVPSVAAKRFAEECECAPLDAVAVSHVLDPDVRRVSILDGSGKEIRTVLYQQRCEGDRHILFMCNTDRKKHYDRVTVRVRAAGKVISHDPVTGGRCLVKSRTSGPWTEFATSLPPTGSRLFEIDSDPRGRIPREKPLKMARKTTLKGLQAVQRTEANVCVLDRAAWRIGEKGPFKKPEEILRVDRAVRDAMGLPHRSGEMLQPWARVIGPDEQRVLLTLRFSFRVETLPDGPMQLAMETPGRFVITLNGKEVRTDADSGWWVDPAIRTLPLDPVSLTPGDNVLELATDFRCDDDLEALYLLGNFGVRVDGEEATLTASPNLVVGDWRDQGMPFYGGGAAYRYHARIQPKAGERVLVRAANFAGATIRVLVNGVHAGYLSWPPYELDITDHLKDIDTEITLELFGSRRNTFGPLHQRCEEPYAIGPDNFTTTGDDWTDGYVLKPCGLLAAPAVIYKA